MEKVLLDRFSPQRAAWNEEVNTLLAPLGLSQDTYTLACLDVSFDRYYTNGLSPDDAVANAAEDYAAAPPGTKASLA